MGVKDEIRPIRVGLSHTLAALTQYNAGQRVPDIIIRGLSKLLPMQLHEITQIWPTLELDARYDIISALLEAAESDFELDFSAFGVYALQDAHPSIRQAAINLLNEQVNLTHMARLFDIAQHDVSDEVRAAAIQGLAPIILEAELGKLPADEVVPVIDYLLGLLSQPRLDVEIRARALEAVAHSSHDAIAAHIQRAYDGDDMRMKTASLVAMGASSDEDWGELVIHELTSRHAAHRYEAARAAGELVLTESVAKLARLALEDEAQIRNVAIWALGEIGGKEAIRVLEAMLESLDEDDDDALVDLLEEALDSASASSGQIYGFSNDFGLD